MSKLKLFFMLICFHIISSSTPIKGDNISEVHSALKEVAFSYYMRGKNIQYETARSAFFSPEEATSQKINYVVCSKIIGNIYKELLNITTPKWTDDYITYAYYRKNEPEIISHTSIINNLTTIKVTFKFPNSTTIAKENLTYKDIAPYLQPGDILIHFRNYTKASRRGHMQMVYDIDKENGDAYIMESTDEQVMVKTKLREYQIYLSKIYRYSGFDDIEIEEGTLRFKKLSEIDEWKILNQVYYYTIIRFIHADEKGIAHLYYDSKFKSTDAIKNKEAITLSPKLKDRLKFKHLYIEKTVNKHNNNVVQIGDKLVYKIKIKNCGKFDYKYDLVVTEKIDIHVVWLDYLSKFKVSSNKPERTLTWNIGKLKSQEEIIIEYSVEVKRGNLGDVIISTGKVGNIPSSTVKNIIGKNLCEIEQFHIKDIYNKLKNNYTSISLINEIYKESFNIDLGLNKLNLKNLIKNEKENSTEEIPTLIKDNPFSKIVLTNHFSVLSNNSNKQYPVYYKLKSFGEYDFQERRQDFIYPELFQTGDILIYTNYFDYSFAENFTFNFTYENGEYAYIYIDDKFVGNNPGIDGELNKRNKFTAKYYYKNNLTLLIGDYNKKDKKWLELANLQTLFSKMYYVILRPSLYYDFTSPCKEEKILNSSKICQRCPINQISSKEALKCINCPLSYYPDKERKNCLKCKEVDYYDKDNKQCRKCKENYYLEEETYECKQCPDGYLSKFGSFYSNSCKKCNPGEYFSYLNGDCVPCAPGTYSNISGATECSICPKGTYSNGSSSFCEECPPGTYSGINRRRCHKCMAGTYSNKGSSECLNCKPMTFSREGSEKCLDCAPGTYSSERAKFCEKCQAGEYLSNGKCEKCDKGTFSNPGDIKCTLCPAGTFSDNPSSNCQNCKAGSYSDKGASYCKECDEGTISGERFAKCIDCPGGFYSPIKGANSCQVCPANEYSTPRSKKCQACPKGKKSEPGSDHCY